MSEEQIDLLDWVAAHPPALLILFFSVRGSCLEGTASRTSAYTVRLAHAETSLEGIVKRHLPLDNALEP